MKHLELTRGKLHKAEPVMRKLETMPAPANEPDSGEGGGSLPSRSPGLVTPTSLAGTVAILGGLVLWHRMRKA